jgi:hypothetical protein
MSNITPKQSLSKQTISEASAEAESRALDFDPTSRATYIRKNVKEIKKWVENNDTEKDIRERVPDFVEKYPELFKKIINKSDLTPINTMLSMLDRMGSGSISQHQASAIIGKQLVDKYVTPKLNGSGKH